MTAPVRRRPAAVRRARTAVSPQVWLKAATWLERRGPNGGINGAQNRQLHGQEERQVDKEYPSMLATEGTDDVHRQEHINRKARPRQSTPTEIADVGGAATIDQQHAPIRRLIDQKRRAQCQAADGANDVQSKEGGQDEDRS